MKNRRASLLDIPFIVIMVLSIGFVILIMGKFANDLRDNLEDNQILTNESLAIYTDYEDSFANVWDSGLLIIVMGLCIASVIGAFMVRTHPIFYGITFLVLISFIILGGIFNNVYEEFRADEQISSIADEFPMYDFIMSKLPVWTLIISILVSIVMFSRPGEVGI